MQRFLVRLSATSRAANLTWRRQGVESAGSSFRPAHETYALKTTKAGRDKSSGPLPDHDSSINTESRIMSSQEFSRRYNGRSAATTFSFNPIITPLPGVPIPPPGWQPPTHQHTLGSNCISPSSDNTARYSAPQSQFSYSPVFYNGLQTSNPSATASTQFLSRANNGGVITKEMPSDDISESSSDAPSVGETTTRLARSQMNTVAMPLLELSTVEVKARTKSKRKAKKKKSKYLIPSKASGGVPNPSVVYIAQSSQPPMQLPVPRNILVVIDLNGTLLHRPNHKSPSRFVERPHARTFLAYCLKTFTVAIWSSARPENVQKMLMQILSPEDQAKVVAIWGRDTLGLSTADYNQRVQCYKRLKVLWNDPRVLASHPEAAHGKRWDQTNTVLVDDSKEKARTEPYNLIRLPEFEGDIAERGFVLPQVHDFLNECARQRDISSYIRVNPFVFQEDFALDG